MAANIDEESTAKAATASEEDPLTEERLGFVREVGAQAVWSLSSCKPGRRHGRLRKVSLLYTHSTFQDSVWNVYGTI